MSDITFETIIFLYARPWKQPKLLRPNKPIFFDGISALSQMTVVHETLKVNDELSVEVDVIYENGEKYVQENTIKDNVNCERKSWHDTPYFDSIGGKLEIPTEDKSHDEPKWIKATKLCKMEYINALSYRINQEYYFHCLYKFDDDEDDEYRVVQLWNL